MRTKTHGWRAATAGLALLALAVPAAAQDADGFAGEHNTSHRMGVAVQESLAELHDLGLQVEVATSGASAAVAVSPPAPVAEEEQTLLERFDSFVESLGVFSRGVASSLEDQILQGVREACVLGDTGFELASVSISLLSVTATFTPTPGLCEAVLAGTG